MPQQGITPVNIYYGLEAGQRTDTLRTDLSTDRPTNGIRSKTTEASDRKSVATGRFP